MSQLLYRRAAERERWSCLSRAHEGKTRTYLPSGTARYHLTVASVNASRARALKRVCKGDCDT